MSSIFQPRMYLEDLKDLPLAYFKERGYTDIILDLDNTIGAYDQKEIDDRYYDILATFIKEGFNITLVSNNIERRIAGFLKDLPIKHISLAIKPFSFGYKRAVERFDIDKDKTISIGDQILTDILGSNMMGIYSILVKPYCNRDSLSTRINRHIESFLIKKGVVKLK